MKLRSSADAGEISAWHPRRWAVWDLILVTIDAPDYARRLNAFSDPPLESNVNAPLLRYFLRKTGGVFVALGKHPARFVELDDPEYGNRLLQAALAVDLDDVDALVSFVNQWGALGLGLR